MENMLYEPAGGSDRHWSNDHCSTSRAVTCEICGTEHEELDINTTRILDIFLGRQLVEDCCGKIIDVLYEEYKRVFFNRYLEEFVSDPFAQPFMAETINKALKKVNEKAKELAGNTEIGINLKP